MSDSFRLFFALPVAEATKDALARVQDRVRSAVPGIAARWTGREQMHLTLKFLGNVELRKVDLLAEAARLACLKFPPLALRAEGLGVFPNARRPRVLWTGAGERANLLEQLANAIRAASAAHVEREPEKPFTGHVTLARLQEIDRASAGRLSNVIDAHSTEVFGEWRVEHVELIRSELSSAGSRYSTVARLALDGIAE